MSRPPLAVSLLLFLATPAVAQVDLPDRPVRPPLPAEPVVLPPAPRGTEARKHTGKDPYGLDEGRGLELPGGTGAKAAGTDTPSARAAASGRASAPSEPSAALTTAARFILDEVGKARSVDDRIVQQAAPSLASLGASGLAAARAALAADHAPTLVVAARTLLASGSDDEAQLVLQRMRGRVPNAASVPLVKSLAEVDPVRAPPSLFAELLTHPQGSMRLAAQRHLATVPSAALVESLELPLAARLTDARLRAVQLLSVCSDERALPLLLERLSDSSAEVARRAVDALAAKPDKSLDSELLRLAFDSRWILRGNAYALLALIEREDLRLEPLLLPQHVDALLGGIASSDPFVAGACAAALAGIGFRSPDGVPTPWLDTQVPARLVLAVSGREFHNDFGSLQPAALRRLALISGEPMSTDGARWVAWWVARAAGFQARRAALSAQPEDAVALRVELLSSGERSEGFRLVGPDPRAQEDVPPLERTLHLSSSQAGELYEVLRREGVFGPERLPGARGSGTLGATTLEVALGGRSKVFRFPSGAGDPWFLRSVASARALFERNRWQLYPLPDLEQGPQDAFLREAEWWDAERTELERDRRLKERVLAALTVRRPSARDEGVHELVGLAGSEGCFDPDDVAPLLALLQQENFVGPRASALVGLVLQAAATAPDQPLSREAGELLVDVLVDSLGPPAADELERVLVAMDRDALRAAAGDERPLVRAVAGTVLARAPEDSDVALLLGLLGDPEPQVEIAVVRALGTGRVEAARTEIFVRARLAEGALRAAALEAVGYLGGESALDVLVIGLSESDPQVALGAARGLAELGDPSTIAMMVTLLAGGGDDPLVAPARAGLLALGQQAWSDLLRAVNTPGSRARREAALLLSLQGVPAAAPALMRSLAEEPGDLRVAGELAVLTGVDLRDQPEPASAWWLWWGGVVHDDSLAWMLAALERSGRPTPTAESIAGAGTAEGGAFLALVLGDDLPPHLLERVRRELGRLLGRELGPPPPPGPERDAWVEELQAEVGERSW